MFKRAIPVAGNRRPLTDRWAGHVSVGAEKHRICRWSRCRRVHARHSRPVRVHRRIARRCRADPGAQRDRRGHRPRFGFQDARCAGLGG